MIRSDISELSTEIDRLQEQTELFYELMTTQIGKVWNGNAYEACYSESKDNREQALLAISECRRIIDLFTDRSVTTDALPSDFLI